MAVVKPNFISEEQFTAMQHTVRGTAQRPAMTKWKDTPEANHSPQGKVSGTKLSPRQAPSPLYKSKWEASYAAKLELEQRAGLIKAYAYEMHTFKLAHRQYHRSDFLIWHLDNSIEIAQVKGWHKNIRAGIKGLKWAVSLNPWFTWTLKRWTGTGWDSSYV